MVVDFAPRQNIKVTPLDVLSSGFDVDSNGLGIVIFSEGLSVRFSIMKPSLSVTRIIVTSNDFIFS